jgi:hypothetical protein
VYVYIYVHIYIYICANIRVCMRVYVDTFLSD